MKTSQALMLSLLYIIINHINAIAKVPHRRNKRQYPSNGIINYGVPVYGSVNNGMANFGSTYNGLPPYGSINNGYPNMLYVNPMGSSAYQMFNNGAYDSTACDGQLFSISCPTGSFIRIISVRYGRQDTYTCSGNYYSYYASNPLQNNPECLLETALPIVQFNCNNQQYCSFTVGPNVFGGVDPCLNLPKALHVRFQCY